jgi:aspartyl-tRNA(Asn)/glutamyl-tRNA(Gln) amidotransferase subunit C
VKKRERMCGKMFVTDETIEYVAALAKLVLSEEEKKKAKEDLGNILAYMDTMNELDTADVEPMSHVFPVRNVFREDIVVNGADRENLLANAPNKKDGCFKVPKTVE